MPLFSERHGYVSKPLQLEEMSPALANRIWNVYSCEVNIDTLDYDSHYLEEILDCLGLPFDNVHNGFHVSANLRRLKDWFDNAEWYEIYDFIEIYLNFLPVKERKDARKSFNDVLAWENAGYRISGTNVIPITNEAELCCVTNAQTTPYSAVNTHMEKAAILLSRRPSADYENSVKESISAVEAMCCIITEDKKATLGDALKKLESKGVKLHRAFQNAMSSLYGYASDEGGIRHGSIDFAGATSEDAKYMLVTCSAFVNYLIEKWEKCKDN